MPLVEKVATLAGATFLARANFMRTMPGDIFTCTHVVAHKTVSADLKAKVCDLKKIGHAELLQNSDTDCLTPRSFPLFFFFHPFPSRAGEAVECPGGWH